MRIALFTDTYRPQVNGVTRTLQRLVAHAVDRGHELALVTPRLGAIEPLAAEHIELPALTVPFYPELRIAVPLDPWTARRLNGFGPDVIHVATEFTIGWSGLGYAAAKPLVTSFHTDFPAYLAGYGFGGLERAAWSWLRSFHGRSRTTLCPSSATRAQLLDRGFHTDIRVWSRGVDAREFRPDRRSAALRRRWAGEASHLLVFVSRLAPEKRVDVLLEAFRSIRATRNDVALLVVGDGPARQEMEAAAPDGTVFAGYLTGDDLAGAYAVGDVFLFPSDTETFGNVVLEAMASGLPVVAPSRGGVLDSVVHGETGWLVEPGNPDAFARATTALLDDPDRRQTFAAAGRAHALRKSWSRILDGVLDVYAEAAMCDTALVA
jgi:glycosyltransferase involved in cell wall biosynthesis